MHRRTDAVHHALKVLLEAADRAGPLRSVRFRPFINVLTDAEVSPQEREASVHVCRHFLRNWYLFGINEAGVLAQALEEKIPEEGEVNPDLVRRVFRVPLGEFVDVVFEFVQPSAAS